MVHTEYNQLIDIFACALHIATHIHVTTNTLPMLDRLQSEPPFSLQLLHHRYQIPKFRYQLGASRYICKFEGRATLQARHPCKNVAPSGPTIVGDAPKISRWACPNSLLTAFCVYIINSLFVFLSSLGVILLQPLLPWRLLPSRQVLLDL